MEYLVFLIYGIIVMQFISNGDIHAKNSGGSGYKRYKIRGVINILVGLFGMRGVNVFLRDKDIVPQKFVWIALAGFAVIEIYGMYCIWKALTTNEP